MGYDVSSSRHGRGAGDDGSEAYDDGHRRTGRRRRRRPLRAAVAAVGVLALVGVLVLAGFAFFLQRTVEGNIEHRDLKADDNSVITISPDVYGANQPRDDAEETGEVDGDAEGGTDDTGLGADGEDEIDAIGEDVQGGTDGLGEDVDEDETAAIVGEDGEAIADLPTEVTASSPERQATAGDSMNFLIIGSDSRDLSVERGRSDVIVLAHVSGDRDRIDLVHFPRDLFVPIAGTGGSSKINAAYAYGGAPLLVQTLQPLVGVPIDHVAIVDFESFRAMTDAIGGVEVQVTEAGGGFDTGVQHMNGEQGLRFVRERYSLSQGDISRGERQMQFIKGIMNKALSRETLTNPARLARFVDAATRNLTVDAALNVGDMRDLAIELRNLRGGDIHFWTGPWCGVDMHPVAGSVVLMADGQMGTLSEHLRTDSMASYSDDVSPREGFGGNC